MTKSICAIVLAAGHGRRFQTHAGEGTSKLLAECVGRDGVMRPVLEHVLINLQGVVDTVLLVTRPDCPAIVALAHHYRCELVLLSSQGMGESIAAAVASQPDHRAWLIVLGDMPFILAQTLQAVAGALRDDMIVQPVFQGEGGHPVGFGHHFGPSLLALTGDQGAKRLFKEGCVQTIDVADSGVLWDVDVPERLVFAP